MIAEILIDDPGNRWHKGEVGAVLDNDSCKYDYRVQLPGYHDVMVAGETVRGFRIFYFFKDEVKVKGDACSPT